MPLSRREKVMKNADEIIKKAEEKEDKEKKLLSLLKSNPDVEIMSIKDYLEDSKNAEIANFKDDDEMISDLKKGYDKDIKLLSAKFGNDKMYVFYTDVVDQTLPNLFLNIKAESPIYKRIDDEQYLFEINGRKIIQYSYEAAAPPIYFVEILPTD